MSIIYSTATENARLQAVITQIGAAGVLKVGTAGMGVLICTIPLANPAGTVAAKVLTLAVPQAAVIAIGGDMAAATIEDSVGNLIASGLTVGTVAGFDLITINTTVAAGDVLSLVSATITGT